MYSAAGDDDDCKYYVSWTATPIKENADITFTVTASPPGRHGAGQLCRGTPGGLAEHQPRRPPPRNPSTEIAPGIYQVGPIKFDAPGTWTVRFHFFEECADAPADSPHGHAAFYVNVP